MIWRIFVVYVDSNRFFTVDSESNNLPLTTTLREQPSTMFILSDVCNTLFYRSDIITKRKKWRPTVWFPKDLRGAYNTVYEWIKKSVKKRGQNRICFNIIKNGNIHVLQFCSHQTVRLFFGPSKIIYILHKDSKLQQHGLKWYKLNH